MRVKSGCGHSFARAAHYDAWRADRLGTMSGAILRHLAFLGIEVNNDRERLFGLAMAVLVAGLSVLYLHRFQIPIIGSKLCPQAA